MCLQVIWPSATQVSITMLMYYQLFESLSLSRSRSLALSLSLSRSLSLLLSLSLPPPECIYRKRLTLDGRQLNVELYDPCSQVRVKIATEPQPDGLTMIQTFINRNSLNHCTPIGGQTTGIFNIITPSRSIACQPIGWHHIACHDALECYEHKKQNGINKFHQLLTFVHLNHTQHLFILFLLVVSYIEELQCLFFFFSEACIL